jgi:hypothetical protein
MGGIEDLAQRVAEILVDDGRLADTLAAIAGPMAYAYSFSTIRSLCFRIFLKKDSQAL